MKPPGFAAPLAYRRYPLRISLLNDLVLSVKVIYDPLNRKSQAFEERL